MSMRIALALVGFLFGAASAYAAAEPQKWCSNGFGKTAVLIPKGEEVVLTIKGRPPQIIDIESTELRNATLMASQGLEDYPQQEILDLP